MGLIFTFIDSDEDDILEGRLSMGWKVSRNKNSG